MNGGVSSKELNKKLLKILDQLKSNSNLLDDSDFIKRIKRRLKAGADPNVPRSQWKDSVTLCC
ncbi:hypothetical protein [Wolbachia endosymbiont (group B) of Limnophora tigrina]|uniref:hypothetical protein n=1 Tax=Wolbachia endosymbiont (group B) of Limnophora tigrina TaxID=3139317 RepID=UPI0035B54024